MEILIWRFSDVLDLYADEGCPAYLIKETLSVVVNSGFVALSLIV